MEKNIRIIFACGGTGGHVNPALAIADKVREVFPDSNILFVGNETGIENKLVKNHGYEFFPVKVTGLSRSISPKGIIHNIGAVKNVFTANGKLAKLYLDFKPDAVVGTGGYMSYPALKTAYKKGIKTLVHESNSLPGMSVKAISAFADVVCTDNSDGLSRLPKSKNKNARRVITGSPLKGGVKNLKTKEEARRSLGLKGDFTVLSFGGSLGSKVLTQAVAAVIKWENALGNINHIHSYGRTGIDFLNAQLENCQTALRKGYALADEYFYNMYDCYAAADLVISRAGAMTLAELKSFGKPSVLVPWSGAAENHQYYNALTMKNNGCSEVITDAELTPEKLLSTVRYLYENSGYIEKMGQNALSCAVPDSAGKIVGEIAEMIGADY